MFSPRNPMTPSLGRVWTSAGRLALETVAHQMLDKWRQRYPELVKLWRELDTEVNHVKPKED